MKLRSSVDTPNFLITRQTMTKSGWRDKRKGEKEKEGERRKTFSRDKFLLWSTKKQPKQTGEKREIDVCGPPN